MMHWLDQLQAELQSRQEDHLLRRLRPLDRCAAHVFHQGRSLLNLAGNDYLALAAHPHLARAVADAARQYGVGGGASRLVSGHLELHRRIESCFAAFKHAQAALITPTGYTANLAALSALAGPDDLIALDKLNHASLIDAAQSTGAQVRVYPHLNLEKLRRLLESHAEARRRFIVTDSVFSMDGDCADLPALAALRDRYQAILMVDEAHATGILGSTGAGLAEHQGVAGRIDVTISTAGKALGGLGGIITGPQVVIDTIVNRARSFIYTTAVPPTQAAAIGAALEVVANEPHRRRRLAELNESARGRLRRMGWKVAEDPTPIIPLIVGEPAAALALSSRLEQAGYLVPAIRPPSVAPGSARLRLTLRCDLDDAELDRFLDTLGGP